MLTLLVGAHGPEVCILQTRLNSKAPTTLPLLSIDGAFGPKTLARVREFQRNAGLSADGVVGPKTWEHLLAQSPAPKTVTRFCDDCIAANQAAAASVSLGQVAFSSPAGSSTRSALVAF